MSHQQPVVMGTQQVVYAAYQTQQPMGGQQVFLPAQVQYNNGQTVIIRTVQAPSPGPRVWENYKSRVSIGLGGTQIAVALLMILLNIIGLVVEVEADTIFNVGYGFWCSPFYLISGGFGVGAGKHKTTCMIVTNMVMCIISALFAITSSVTCSAVGVATDSETSIVALHGVMLILALVEFVVAIVASALCCAAVCCGRSRSQVTTLHSGPGAMLHGQHLQTGGQIYPPTQYPASYPMTSTGLQGDLSRPPPYAETMETKG